MFSKAAKYAIRSVLYLAEKADEESKVGVNTMAEALGVPKHYLAKILQELARNHLISSVKGPKGGFYLSKENWEVSLMQVLHCIDGKEMLEGCILGLPICSSEDPCPLHFQVVGYRDGLRHHLSTWSIKEIEEGKLRHHLLMNLQ